MNRVLKDVSGCAREACSGTMLGELHYLVDIDELGILVDDQLSHGRHRGDVLLLGHFILVYLFELLLQNRLSSCF